jgi:hypothetical protein
MNTVISLLTSKDTWVVVGMFLLAWLLSAGIESVATQKDTYLPILGILPSIVIWYFYFVKPKK